MWRGLRPRCSTEDFQGRTRGGTEFPATPTEVLCPVGVYPNETKRFCRLRGKFYSCFHATPLNFVRISIVRGKTKRLESLPDFQSTVRLPLWGRSAAEWGERAVSQRSPSLLGMLRRRIKWLRRRLQQLRGLAHRSHRSHRSRRPPDRPAAGECHQRKS